MIRDFGRRDLIAKSDFVAHHDPDKCLHCGECAKRCAFGARIISQDSLAFNTDACLGCGLCITTCPADAIIMQAADKNQYQKDL